MAHLLKCPLDTRRFRNIKNLAAHMRSKHPQALSARMRIGQANSKKNPNNRNKAITQCVQEIAGLVATVTPAIVTRDPSFAPAIISSIAKSIEACKEFIPGLLGQNPQVK